MARKRNTGGRPKLPDDQKTQAVRTTVPAEVHRALIALGTGSAIRGARLAILAHFEGPGKEFLAQNELKFKGK